MCVQLMKQEAMNLKEQRGVYGSIYIYIHMCVCAVCVIRPNYKRSQQGKFFGKELKGHILLCLRNRKILKDASFSDEFRNVPYVGESRVNMSALKDNIRKHTR